MATGSSPLSTTPSLTPGSSRASTPTTNGIPVQPDHFYCNDGESTYEPEAGKAYLDPNDDPFAHRGIPVFKPSMDEFRDFETYMKSVECWGMKSGIIKVVPPREWKEGLPKITKAQFSATSIRSPIEQNMIGSAGQFRQENVVKRKAVSVREWVEKCALEDYRAPGVHDLDGRAGPSGKLRRSRRGMLDDEIPRIVDVEEQIDIGEDAAIHHLPPPPPLKSKPPKQVRTRETRELAAADKAARDDEFLDSFDPDTVWLPADTKATDYTSGMCRNLERKYWRSCGIGKAPWYGADTQGSLFTDETTSWNVAHLDSTLSRLLPSGKGLPGVNTPYLYWGMWRATFAWHVEDMDLFSINYIHFGAPKFWYAIPQGRAGALEQTMKGLFPQDISQCPQFLRHKSFLVSPTLLARSSCKPNNCVQHAGEFIITYPRGYHAGFNLGLNCAESVNFALDSWIEMGRKAKACECIDDSVKIDVDQLIRDREAEAEVVPESSKPTAAKRKASTPLDVPANKRPRSKKEPSSKPKAPPTNAVASTSTLPRLTLKLGPRPPSLDSYPCVLCISTSQEGLRRVHDIPYARKEAAGNPSRWMAHESCANVIPETWVDEVVGPEGVMERVIFGVDGIVKDRWNLKCSACLRSRPKAHGAPIQCTKGKCSKAFHVSCAREGAESHIVYRELSRVQKEVVLVDHSSSGTAEEVLKVIEKVEVEVLCAQHNPDLAAAKRASKEDRTRIHLLALPPNSLIKIRVNSGVFEVLLARVLEDIKSVEVVWDKGVKRVFRWSSVVFATGAPIQRIDSSFQPGPPPPVATVNPLQYASTLPQLYTSESGPLPPRPSETIRIGDHHYPTYYRRPDPPPLPSPHYRFEDYRWQPSYVGPSE